VSWGRHGDRGETRTRYNLSPKPGNPGTLAGFNKEWEERDMGMTKNKYSQKGVGKGEADINSWKATVA